MSNMCSRWRAELGGGGARVFLDIGCNKGYSSFEIFEIMDPTLNLTVPQLVAFRKDVLKDKRFCGPCRQCRDTNIRSANMQAPVNLKVYCYDASRVHYNNLIIAKQYFMGNASRVSYSTASVAQWEIVHAAASDHVGTARFPACDTEACSLDHSTTPKITEVVNVRMTTVDNEMLIHGLNYIDFLKIDAEGYDPAVLRGAERALSHRRIGMLQFEYNKMGLWKSTNLSDTIVFMARLGYSCYFEGRPTLARLTGCWSTRYEFKSWSNIVSTHTHHFMFSELYKLSFLSQIM